MAIAEDARVRGRTAKDAAQFRGWAMHRARGQRRLAGA
jgi:hypothetical protein